MVLVPLVWSMPIGLDVILVPPPGVCMMDWSTAIRICVLHFVCFPHDVRYPGLADISVAGVVACIISSRRSHPRNQNHTIRFPGSTITKLGLLY